MLRDGDKDVPALVAEFTERDPGRAKVFREAHGYGRQKFSFTPIEKRR